MISPLAMVRPSADVAPSASVGARTRVWDHAAIREDAVIGDDCVIGRGVYIDVGVRIGDRVKIEDHAVVYHGVTVEAGVFIGPGVITTNDRTPRSVTLGGRPSTTGDWQVSPIRLSEGCSIGGGAVLVGGWDVGRYAMVGAGSVVTRDVPYHALVVGNPARLLGWVCACGARLAIDGHPVEAGHQGIARCPEDGRAYDIDAERCAHVDGL